MSTYEDRLTALEQTSVSRAELTEAMNKLERQQAQAWRDRTHETAMALGVLTDDVRILKENVRSIKIRVDEGFPDLSRDLYSMEEKLTKRSVSLETKVDSIEKRFDQRLAKLEEQQNEQGQDIKDLHTKFDRLEKLLLDRLPPSP